MESCVIKKLCYTINNRLGGSKMNQGLQTLVSMWPILAVGIIFYFLLWRPQKKQQHRRKQFLNSLKKGDKIITIGGIYGKIISINKEIITLQVSDKVEIKISLSGISRYQNFDRQPEQISNQII